jgi:hypothetical protein
VIRPDKGCKIKEANVPVMVLGETANINLVLFERIVGKMMVEQDSGDDFTKRGASPPDAAVNSSLHHRRQCSSRDTVASSMNA